ncbi:hypothetical protein [Flaviaesturariibacter amylovorans]|uniref:Uncharacterized protein n=1 Tax=Flaviaesturariibacter amylovorans TaxID=1084520 RepID=A0ABP8H626_9BACT
MQPPETDRKLIERIKASIERLELRVSHIQDKDCTKIVGNTADGLRPSMSFIHDEMERSSFTADLRERLFWISHELLLSEYLLLDRALALKKFKLRYENEHGFDDLQGEQRLQLNSTKLPDMLYEFMTLRWGSMLEIAAWKSPLLVNTHFRFQSFETSDELALKAAAELQPAFGGLQAFLAPPRPETGHVSEGPATH